MNPHPPSGIWSRPYALALLANFLVFFVISSFVLYPVLIQSLGGSDTDIGVIMGVFSLVSVALRPAGGLTAEKLGYRAVSLFGIAVVIAVLPFFAVVRGTGADVILLRALLGVGWSCILSPLMALATRLTPAERLSESLGIYGISGLMAHGMAPLVGEWVVAVHGFRALFYLDGALAVAAFLLVVSIRTPEAPLTANHQNLSAATGGGNVLRLAIIGGVLLAVGHGTIRGINTNFIAPYCLHLDLERFMGFTVFSPFFVAFTFSAMITRFKLAALPDRFGRRQVAIPSALLIAANCVLISQIRSTPVLILAGLLGGLGQGLVFPSLSSLMVDLLGHHRRAFALSVYATCFEIGAGLGLIAFGVVADALGYRWMFGIAGLLMAFLVAVFAWMVPGRSGLDGQDDLVGDDVHAVIGEGGR